MLVDLKDCLGTRMLKAELHGKLSSEGSNADERVLGPYRLTQLSRYDRGLTLRAMTSGAP